MEAILTTDLPTILETSAASPVPSPGANSMKLTTSPTPYLPLPVAATLTESKDPLEMLSTIASCTNTLYGSITKS